MAKYSRTNLIINYLPQDFSDEEFRGLFSSVAPVRRAKVCRDKRTGYSFGFGFCEFYSAEEASRAIRALNGLRLRRKTIKVAHARLQSAESKNCNLHLTGLPPGVGTDDIRAVMSPFGGIINCKLLADAHGTSRGVGFCLFETRSAAADALAALHGKPWPLADGSSPPHHLPVQIRFADENEKKVRPPSSPAGLLPPPQLPPPAPGQLAPQQQQPQPLPVIPMAPQPLPPPIPLPSYDYCTATPSVPPFYAAATSTGFPHPAMASLPPPHLAPQPYGCYAPAVYPFYPPMLDASTSSPPPLPPPPPPSVVTSSTIPPPPAAAPPTAAAAPAASPPAATLVRVCNLPPSVDESQLCAMFAPFGCLTGLQLEPAPGHQPAPAEGDLLAPGCAAIVAFAAYPAAAAAASHWNGQAMCGRYLQAWLLPQMHV